MSGLQDFPKEILATIGSYITDFRDIFAVSMAFRGDIVCDNIVVTPGAPCLQIHNLPELNYLIASARDSVTLSSRVYGDITINAARATVYVNSSLSRNITANNCDLTIIGGGLGTRPVIVNGAPRSISVIDCNVHLVRTLADCPITLIDCDVGSDSAYISHYGPLPLSAFLGTNVTVIALNDYCISWIHSMKIKPLLDALKGGPINRVQLNDSSATVEELIAAINVIAALPEPPLCTKIVTSHAATLLAHFGRVHPLADVIRLAGAGFKISSRI